MATSITIDAYAKINLGLKILGLREDGYHEVETTLQNISIADRLKFSLINKSSEISLNVNLNLGIPPDQNFVHKAAELFLSQAEISQGLSIELYKKIPASAGLGGGSSDAAATLVALNELFDLNVSLEFIDRLAAELGSDVPFFLRGGRATASGRGERLTFKEMPNEASNLVVLKPRVDLKTADVYKAFDGLENQESPTNSRKLHNDLEAAALSLEPSLSECTAFLEQHTSGKYGMSGSGSAYYAFVESEEEGRKVIDAAENVLDCTGYYVRQQPYAHRFVGDEA